MNIETIKRLYRKWDSFWFGAISPYPLAAFRIMFGVFLFWYFIDYLFIIDVVFSNQGVYLPVFLHEIAPSPLGAYIMYGFIMLLILAFFLGFYTRVITPLLLFTFLYYYILNLAVFGTSYDMLIILLLSLLSFATLDKVWTVRSFWSNRGREEGVLIMGWVHRILCLHLCVVYFGMVAYKLTDMDWYSGIALERNLHAIWATPVAFWIVSLNLPIGFFTFLTWATLFTELMLSLGLAIRRIQYFVFFSGFCLHLCVVYFGMVAYKLTDMDWYSGIALERNLHAIWATPVAFWIVSLNLPIGFFTFLTWATLFTELMLSLGLAAGNLYRTLLCFYFRPFNHSSAPKTC